MKTKLLLIIALFILAPVTLEALSARIETVEGDVLQVSDFSMDGRRAFSVDQVGGIGRLDWKEISSFEIKQMGMKYWVEVRFPNDKKETLKLRQFSSFRGKSDLGQMIIPFEKVKRVSLMPSDPEAGKKEDLTVKESNLPVDSPPLELTRVTLRNGDILMGDLLAESISIKTIYGTISFKKKDIQKVTFGKTTGGQREVEKDTLYSKYGDKVTGTITGTYLNVKLRTDTDMILPRHHVQEIEFPISSDNEPRSIREPPEPGSKLPPR